MSKCLKLFGLLLSGGGAVLALVAAGVWQYLFQAPWSKLFEGRGQLRDPSAALRPARPGWSFLGLGR